MDKNIFTQEELKNIAVLLQRVDLKGNEALAVAQLQVKIGGLINPEPVKETPKEEEPKTN